MNITYFFLEIFKVLLTTSDRLLLGSLVSILLLSSCQSNIETTAKEASVTNVQKRKVPVDSLIVNTSEGLVYFGDEPFSGVSVSYHKNKTQASEIQYQKGRKHGAYTKWFDSGTMSFTASYHEGKLHGTSKSWWRNGNLRSESSFTMGIAQGLQKQWYKSGQLFKEQQLVNGKEEGMQKSWRENGKLYNNYEAKNGRIFGLKRAALCYSLENEEVQYEN